MMMIEITIINSSSVNPACHLLRACCKLPVTVLLSIQGRRLRLRAHVENVFTAPRIRIGRIVTGTQLPISLSRHRIDRQRPQVNFLLRRQLPDLGCINTLLSRSGSINSRYHVNAVDERVEIGRIAIRIVYAEDRAIANHDLAARIDQAVALLLSKLTATSRATL